MNKKEIFYLIGVRYFLESSLRASLEIDFEILIVRWRLTRPGHPRVCRRKNVPCSFSRRLVSRLKTALGNLVPLRAFLFALFYYELDPNL